MKVGLDLDEERVSLEVNTGFRAGSGLTTTVNMTANTARAVAAQLIATADALDTSMKQGYLGNEEHDG